MRQRLAAAIGSNSPALLRRRRSVKARLAPLSAASCSRRLAVRLSRAVSPMTQARPAWRSASSITASTSFSDRGRTTKRREIGRPTCARPGAERDHPIVPRPRRQRRLRRQSRPRLCCSSHAWRPAEARPQATGHPRLECQREGRCGHQCGACSRVVQGGQRGRTALEYMLVKTGPTNAAVFLPASMASAYLLCLICSSFVLVRGRVKRCRQSPVNAGTSLNPRRCCDRIHGNSGASHAPRR